MLGILDATAHLRRVVWWRETLLLASQRTGAGVEDLEIVCE